MDQQSTPAPDAATASGIESEVIEFLAQRFSVGPKYLVGPAPTPAQWQQVAAVAARAPDHRALRPFRFVVVGDEHRAALADLFARDAVDRGHAADEIERARARAYNGPGLVALVARVRDGVDDVPGHEQWMCVGAALMNLLNALHLMGFGAKTLSGASVRAAAIRAAFCDEGETLVAWVIAGTATRSVHAKDVGEAPPVIGPWAGPGAPGRTE